MFQKISKSCRARESPLRLAVHVQETYTLLQHSPCGSTKDAHGYVRQAHDGTNFHTTGMAASGAGCKAAVVCGPVCRRVGITCMRPGVSGPCGTADRGSHWRPWPAQGLAVALRQVMDDDLIPAPSKTSDPPARSFC